ncbi:hypothetical protein [Niallia sp. NCCP-28]|uniref:hypothetical protein n=1 Tax=Niallia sp. NCCP-28 TaxID=2934712 RepID=UPI0020833A61|nr:hypothetical protein [Niallia sp. NCCP-28]GKU81948.1 hypothetical protein NCCP28_13440 [Niallia sp. NCCP-28]
MIDWYIILFIATIIIIYCLDRIVEHHSPYDFFFSKKELGIKQGTVLLCISFFSGFSLFIPLFILFSYGLFIGVIFYAVFVLLFFFVIKGYLKGFYQQDKKNANILYFYKKRFTAKGFKFFLLLLIFANMEGLVMQMSVAHKIFQVYFTSHSIVFVGLILLFSLIIAGLGGLETIYKTGYLILIICSFSLLFVPLFLYVKAGTHTIFQAYSLYEATKEISVSKMLLILLSILIAQIGAFLTNVYSYQVLHSISIKYIKSTIKLSLFCYSAVPIALLVYGAYVVSLNQTSLYFTFGYTIFHYSGKILSIMIVIVWISSIIFSVISSIFALSTLLFFCLQMRKGKGLVKIKSIYFFTIFLCCCMFLLQFIFVKYSMELAIIYGLFYIAASMPLRSVGRKDKRHSVWLIVYIVFIWGVGMFFALSMKEFYSGFLIVVAGAIIHFSGGFLLKILKMNKIT